MSETADTDTATDAPTDDSTDITFDAPDGAAATIVTAGDPIRSFFGVITDALRLDEAKVHLTDHALDVRAVDPANVGMIDMSAAASGFTGYRGPSDGLTVGMPLNYKGGGGLQSALSYARKRPGDGDPVRIDIYDDTDSTRVRVAVIRPDQRTKRVTEFFAVDPDTMRQRPELPPIDLPWRADPDVDALLDAAKTLTMDHAWLAHDDGALVVGTQPTQNPELAGDADQDMVDAISFPDRAWQVDDVDVQGDKDHGSLFSQDYLTDFAKALQRGKADRVTVAFGQEFPAKLSADWTDWGFEGTLVVAPRIQGD